MANTDQELELKYVWKLSRNSSSFKENCFITCKDNLFQGIGEAAPNIRYNETPEGLLNEFEAFLPELKNAPDNPEAFSIFIQQSKLHNALKFGIESAYWHYYAAKNKTDLGQLFSLPPQEKVRTCYTLPIMEPAEIPAFYRQYNLQRFKYLKVKVSDAGALEMLSTLHQLGKHQFMIDANEAWKEVEELIRFMPQLKPFPIEFIEQPMPSAFVEEYKYLKPHSVFPLMADESVLNQPDMDEIAQQFHGVNMKLMKAGSYLNGMRIIKEAKARGLITMVGCMVETTLGISGAWHLAGLTDYADLDGCLIVANEPYHLLEEKEGFFYKTNQTIN